MKKIMGMVLVLTMMVTVLAVPASAANGSSNVFNVRLSSSYAKVNRGNNNGAKMISRRWDDKYGVIKLYTRFDLPFSSLGNGDEIVYRITDSIHEGARIQLSFAGRVVNGKIHTYNGGKRFGNITKIDGIGGGYYLRYN